MVQKKTLLLSGFEFLTLGEVFLGVVFHQKLIGGGPKCPTCVLHVKNTCFLLIIHLFLHIKLCFYTQKPLLLSGFVFLTLGGVILGTIFLQKFIGDGLTCLTHVFHVENNVLWVKKTHVLCAKTCVFHM